MRAPRFDATWATPGARAGDEEDMGGHRPPQLPGVAGQRQRQQAARAARVWQRREQPRNAGRARVDA